MSIIEKLNITPVPWGSDDGYGNGIYGRSVGGCRNEMAIHKVADIRGWGHLQYRNDGEAVIEGNTRLIMQAPAMLEALIAVCLYAEEELNGDCANETYVVEKATGKSWAEIKELI